MGSKADGIAAGVALLASDIGVGLAVIDTDSRVLFINPSSEKLLGRSLSDVIGKHVAEVRSPERASAAAAVVDQVRNTGEPVRGGRVSHEGRTWESVYAPLPLEGELVVSVVSFDVTELDGALAAARSAAARQKSLTEFSLLALMSADIQSLLDEAVAFVVREFDLDFATVLTVIDAREEARLGQSRFLVEHGVVSSISVPIWSGPKIWGVLQGRAKLPREFSEDDVQAVLAIVNVLGAAVARAVSDSQVRRLSTQRRRLIREALEATARERRRIADGLHDDVLQHLLFARQELDSAEAGDGADMVRASSSLADGIRLLRAVVGDLHPLALSGRGLSETLVELTRAAQRPGLTTSSRLAPGIDSRHDALVASAVRELLTNVIKHARASTAEVAVSANGRLVIEVSDDGIGLDPAAMTQAVVGGHIGLASLIERVEAIDGRIELRDHHGADAYRNGTLVRVSLPLP